MLKSMLKKQSTSQFTAPQVITFGFASIILLGAILLSLPISSKTGRLLISWTRYSRQLLLLV